MDLRELSDRQEISDLITAYTRAVDTARFSDLADVFTDDAVLDYTSPGGPVGSLAEVAPFIELVTGFERWQHLIGQIEIAFDGADAARATAYFFNPMVARNPDGSEHVVEVGGYYHHDLVRTPDGWRSRKIVDEIVWSR